MISKTLLPLGCGIGTSKPPMECLPFLPLLATSQSRPRFDFHFYRKIDIIIFGFIFISPFHTSHVPKLAKMGGFAFQQGRASAPMAITEPSVTRKIQPPLLPPPTLAWLSALGWQAGSLSPSSSLWLPSTCMSRRKRCERTWS